MRNMKRYRRSGNMNCMSHGALRRSSSHRAHPFVCRFCVEKKKKKSKLSAVRSDVSPGCDSENGRGRIKRRGR